MSNEADTCRTYILSKLQAAVRVASGVIPFFHFGDASRDALLLSVLDRAFKGEL